MRRERFWSFPLRLGRIEPDLSYPSARSQQCRHSAGEHNASSAPVRKGRKSRGMSCKRKKTPTRSSDESRSQPLNLKFSVHAHIPVTSGPTFALWPITWDRSHPKKLGPVAI
jgi:hypothetical protein